MAIALHRKYRPKKLDDLVAQEANVEILKSAAKKNLLGQAYLFYGSRGTGKTTTARLVAKLLNCEKRQSDEKFSALGEPCDECRSCKEINANNAFDVIEIDAASNRGIDEIRNLKESVQTSPVTSKYKVYIIDEAHMLTTPAFNALLKTLEEPPRHAVFILATTEYEKLPATITSRVQRFLFKKPSKAEIAQKLSLIAKAEKIDIDAEAIELVAAAGDGSFRDAESLLDQISSYGKKIDLAIAERLTGRIGLKKIHALASSIVTKNLKESLSQLAEANEEGMNIVQLTKDLIHYMRKIIALQASPSLETGLARDLTSDELADLKKLTAQADSASLIVFLKSLIRAYTEIRYSPFAAIPLEIALVEHLSSPSSASKK